MSFFCTLLSFKCVKDCAAFMDLHDVKSLYTCYSICLFEVDPDSEDHL